HYVGRAYRRSVTLYDEFKRLPLPTEEKVVKVAMTDFNMRAFTSFSPTYRWVIDRLPTDDGYEVRLIDLRYRNKGHYPFVAVVHVSRSEEHTSELQSRFDLVCRLLLEKKNN